MAETVTAQQTHLTVVQMSYMYDTHPRNWRSAPRGAEEGKIPSCIVVKSNKIFINVRVLTAVLAYDMYDKYDIPRGNRQRAKAARPAVAS